jgi:hypothetical protein
VNSEEPSECEPCVAEALSRVLAVRDLLDCVLWGDTHPTTGLDASIKGLQNARGLFMVAGFEGEQ